MQTNSLIKETEAQVIDLTGIFNDKRLEKRGEKIIDNIVNKETAVLNQFSDNRADLVGASRFFDNDSVTEDVLIKATANRCTKSCTNKHVLALQDTSEINYEKHRGKLSESDNHLGPVGNNKDIGFFIHPVFVLERETGFPLCIPHVHIWNRDWDKGTKKERNYKSLPIEEKESYRWIECSNETKEVLEEAASVTIITDREGDIYEEFVEVPDDKTDLLIRSVHNRKLYEKEEKLFEHLDNLEPQGVYLLEIKSGQKKRQPREAKMEVRYAKVQLAKPSRLKRADYPDYVELYAIEAREIDETVPEGEERVLWRLLTTHKIENLQDALEAIYWYSLRWRIEELFRTLKKQGLDLESSQLESGNGLKKLAIMGLNAALIIMQLVGDRDGEVGESGELVFTEKELECLKEVGKSYEGKTVKQKNPFEEYSLAWAAWIIGRLGGWKGYRKAGPAGPITMRRGLERFSILFKGWLLHEALEVP